MRRVSSHLAGTVGSVKAVRGGAKNKWQTTIYDTKGERRWVVVKAESKEEAIEKAQKLAKSKKSIPKGKGKFSKKDLRAVIDKALENNRIKPEDAKRLKTLSLGDMRRKTRHLSEIVDGRPVYKPKIPISSWTSLRLKMDKKDKANIQQRVSKKLNSAKNVSKEAYQALLGEMDYIKEVKTSSDLAKWENLFNNKHAELVGDWKTVGYNHLNKSPEGWARENIRNHARREFLRSGLDKKESIKKAVDYINGLSKADLVDWHNILIPIKKYNDRVYNVAISNDNPDALKKILAVHHVQPVGKGGTVFDPDNIRGVRGGRHRFSAGSEHAKIHDSLFDSYYDDLQRQGITTGRHAPRGSGGSSLKMFSPDGELLNADEWVAGLKEGTTKPPTKFSLMNIFKGVKGGLLGTAVSLPLLMSNSPRAQAAGEIISAGVDPVGYSLFSMGDQLWKRRRKVDPNMAPWQRRLVDPTHGGGLRRY